jgi:hypothetical protein
MTSDLPLGHMWPPMNGLVYTTQMGAGQGQGWVCNPSHPSLLTPYGYYAPGSQAYVPPPTLMSQQSLHTTPRMPNSTPAFPFVNSQQPLASAQPSATPPASTTSMSMSSDSNSHANTIFTHEHSQASQAPSYMDSVGMPSFSSSEPDANAAAPANVSGSASVKSNAELENWFAITLSTGGLMMITPAQIAIELSQPRFKKPWESWEKHIVVFFWVWAPDIKIPHRNSSRHTSISKGRRELGSRVAQCTFERV